MLEVQRCCEELGRLNRRLAALDDLSPERPIAEAGVLGIRERLRELVAELREGR